MSVLLDEPQEYVDAMFEVRRRRSESAEFGADSQLFEG